MSAKGLEVFDTTTQKTMVWLKEISEALHWEDRHRSYLALRGCLHQIRDLLSVEEVAHLGAQLPMLIRGIYYEGWDPTKKAQRPRTRDDFADVAGTYFPSDMAWDYERIMSGCLAVVLGSVDPGVARHIIGAMPTPIVDLWQRATV